MTIHHDKLAYGKLASQSEELSEEKLLEMLSLLEEYNDEEKSNTDEGEARTDKRKNS